MTSDSLEPPVARARMSVYLSGDRHHAIYLHLFVVQKRSLEGAPGPWVETEFLRDTEARLPPYARSGYYGKEAGGTGWPDRHRVADLPIATQDSDSLLPRLKGGDGTVRRWVVSEVGQAVIAEKAPR